MNTETLEPNELPYYLLSKQSCNECKFFKQEHPTDLSGYCEFFDYNQVPYWVTDNDFYSVSLLKTAGSFCKTFCEKS